jgi:hypothetical protein
LEEIKKGKKLKRNALKQAFNEINQNVKQLFTSFQHENVNFEKHVRSERDKKAKGPNDSESSNCLIPETDIPISSERDKKAQGPGDSESSNDRIPETDMPALIN